jgi:hypothetical protein
VDNSTVGPARALFDDADLHCARVSRSSIDVLQAHFRDSATRDDWACLAQLEAGQGVPQPG